MYNVYTGTVTENDLRVKFHHIPGFNLDAWVQKGYFKAVPARTGSYEVVSSMIKSINSDGKDSIQEPD